MLPTHNEVVPCRKCHVEMKFIKTPSGKFMPVNAKPIKVVTEDGKVISAYTPHWGNCTAPDHFRKNIDGLNKGLSRNNQEPTAE